MRYEELVAEAEAKMEQIRTALREACETDDQEVRVAKMKEAKVISGRIYTDLTKDYQAVEAGQDPVRERQARVEDAIARRAERAAETENRRAARARERNAVSQSVESPAETHSYASV